MVTGVIIIFLQKVLPCQICTSITKRFWLLSSLQSAGHLCGLCKHVIIHSDSQAAVGIINKGSTKNPLIMGFLRRLFWLSAIYNCRITARYIKGVHNVIADAISRMHMPSYLLQAYSFISRCTHRIAVLSQNLLLHMLYNTALFLFFRYSGSHFSKGTQC